MTMTFKQCEKLIRLAVLQSLNLSINVFAADNSPVIEWDFPPENIRMAYQTEGQPFFKNSDNIVFIYLQEDDKWQANKINTILTKAGNNIDGVFTRTSMKTLKSLISIYGSSGGEIADKIRDGFYREDIKKMLRKEYLFYVPDIPMPIHTREVINNSFFDRRDLIIKFTSLHCFIPENIGGITEANINIIGGN